MDHKKRLLLDNSVSRLYKAHPGMWKISKVHSIVLYTIGTDDKYSQHIVVLLMGAWHTGIEDVIPIEVRIPTMRLVLTKCQNAPKRSVDLVLEKEKKGWSLKKNSETKVKRGRVLQRSYMVQIILYRWLGSWKIFFKQGRMDGRKAKCQLEGSIPSKRDDSKWILHIKEYLRHKVRHELEFPTLKKYNF